MKFYFCEKCGKRLTDAEIQSGQARDKKLKGVFCADCAVGVLTMESLPVSEESARKILAQEQEAAAEQAWYYCENCSARVTRDDLAVGLGKDKQLKGVFCKTCAEGVLTVSFDALTLEQAQELTRREPRRPAATRTPAAGRPASDRLVAPHRARPHVQAHGSNPQRNLILAAGAGVLVLGLLLWALGGSNGPARGQPAKTARPEPVAPPPPEPVAPPPAHPAKTRPTSEAPDAPAPAPDPARPEAPAVPVEAAPSPAPPNPAPARDPAPGTVNLSDGLMAWWSFDEPDGATSVRDRSGKGHEGALKGKAAFAQGIRGRALDLDGQASYVEVAPSDLLSSEAFTVSFWIFRRVEQDNYATLKKDSVNRVEGWLHLTANRGTMFLINGKTKDHLDGYKIPLNEWHHYAVVYAGERTTFYGDGVELGRGVAFRPRPYSAGALWLGAGGWKKRDTRLGLDGMLDEIRIYHRALQPAEVQALSHAERGVAPPEPEPQAEPSPREAPAPQTTETPSPGALAAIEAAKARKALVEFQAQAVRLAQAGESGELSAWIEAGLANSDLKDQRKHIEAYRLAVGWAKDLGQAVSQGIETLKEADGVRLKLKTGAPLLVGRKGVFRLREFTDGTLRLQGDGLSMDVPLSNLHPEFVAELQERGLGAGARAHLLRGFLRWSAEPPKPGQARAELDAARKAGAPGAEVDFLAALLNLDFAGGLEREADRSWTGIEALAAKQQWRDLPPLLDAFQQLYGDTALARSKAEALKALGAEARARTADLQEEGLLAYWDFDEGEGKTARNRAADKCHGRLEGEADWTPGLKGAAVRFTGNKGCVFVSDAGAFAFNKSSFTICLWARIEKPQYLMVRDKIGWRGWLLNADEFNYSDSKGPGVSIHLPERIKWDPQRWLHYAVVMDREAGTTALYLDGELKAQKPVEASSQNIDGGALLLGGRPSGVPPYFQGDLDEVRVYLRALSPEEIKARYKQLAPLKPLTFFALPQPRKGRHHVYRVQHTRRVSHPGLAPRAQVRPGFGAGQPDRPRRPALRGQVDRGLEDVRLRPRGRRRRRASRRHLALRHRVEFRGCSGDRIPRGRGARHPGAPRQGPVRGRPDAPRRVGRDPHPPRRGYLRVALHLARRRAHRDLDDQPRDDRLALDVHLGRQRARRVRRLPRRRQSRRGPVGHARLRPEEALLVGP
ncbi:MAG: LamG domain-containing protein [Planctomycetota bacterium]|nr:LamG domain-containing protein [Planctomycetota bacterium]